jgi:hypothetical protein
LAWYSLLIKEAETISVVSHFNIVIKDTLIIYHTTSNNATLLQKDIKKNYLTHSSVELARGVSRRNRTIEKRKALFRPDRHWRKNSENLDLGFLEFFRSGPRAWQLEPDMN